MKDFFEFPSTPEGMLQKSEDPIEIEAALPSNSNKNSQDIQESIINKADLFNQLLIADKFTG